MTNRESSDEIFDLLNTSGLSRSYVKSLLPSWWDQQATDNPAGLSEFKLLLSRNLGIDIEGISKSSPEVNFKLPHVRKLKHSTQIDEKALSPTIAISLSVAKTVLASCKKPYIPLPPAQQLRKEIFKNPNISYLSLRALIRTCWDHGIVVIYIKNFPEKIPKMDGMVIHLSERPFIFLSKNTKFSSWMSFILAHEMGHLANNHCVQGEALIDEIVIHEVVNEKQPQSNNTNDLEEKEADEYAFTLLTGHDNDQDLYFDSKNIGEIAKKAIAIQRNEKIDAGHVILKCAYKTKEWPKWIAALKLVDREQRAITDIQEAMINEIDTTQLSDQALEYLFKMTGI